MGNDAFMNCTNWSNSNFDHMGYKHDITDIIDKGTELFRKKGYNSVGINEVLKTCGIPKGSFYNFFESKEDFAIKALERYERMNVENAKIDLEDKSVSPLERVKNFYAKSINWNENDGCNAGCLINSLANEMAGTNENISKAVDKSFNEFLDMLSACLREAQDQNQVRTDMSAEDLAEYIHTGFFGSFSRMKMTRSRDYMDKWLKMTFDFIEA